MGSQRVDMSRTVRIGVDVGGTNTDAVAINPTQQSEPGRGVLAHHKTPHHPGRHPGNRDRRPHRLEKVSPRPLRHRERDGRHHPLHQRRRRARRAPPPPRRHPAPVPQLPARDPALFRVPPALTKIIKGYVGYCDGGLHIDGSEEAPVVEAQVVDRCREIRALGLTAVVVVGAFSPIDEVFHQEDRVRDIVLREMPPGTDVVVSHEVANIGLLERENASILNAAILQYARCTVRGFRRAMKALDLHCPLFLTQNDGTLLDAAAAAKIPIRTFNSGATNSMRGAAYLAGHDTQDSSAIVADIGGTTTDVGVLLPSGLPRQASAYVTVAGVRVNYSMPHLHSVGLGGGSIVRQTEDGKVAVGPGSVGHYLTQKALAFGGDVVTASDIAVAAGRAKMGTCVVNLDPNLVTNAEHQIKMLLEGVVDLIKTSPEPLPVLLVGGGAVLSPSSLEGASELRLPPFHDVANAVGAAISNVGGTVDVIQSVADQSITDAVERAKSMAIQRALDSGAERDSVRIAEEESYPVTYVANKLRTVVKAIGKLDINLKTELLVEEDDEGEVEEEESEVAKDFSIVVTDEPEPVNPITYRPTVIRNESTGILEWHISETDINYLADGCYVLGCAGGGSPAASRIQLRDMLRAGHTMRVIDSSSLDPKAVVYWGGHMGSPATSNERLQSTETVLAFQALMEYRREESFDAVISLEIGGANGLEPFLVGSSRFFDRPILDADFMGRAYPTYWQTTLAVHAPNELVPCAIDSGDGKTIIMTRAPDDEIVDRALRASCSEMGSRVGMASCPTTAEKVGNFSVLRTVSLAWRIGRCIARAEATNTLSTVAESIVQEAGGEKSAKVLFRGKIVAVERRLFKGHSHGSITIAGLSASEEENSGIGQHGIMPAFKTGGTLMIPFKNENLFAEHTAEDGTTKTIIASVPDLICVLDTSSGRNLGVPEFKYGFRVTVLGITCSPRWTETPAGLKIGGPRAFGYDMDYHPIGEYVEPKSVIEEFAPTG
ncbi:d-amino acid hydantoin hydrolase (hydantoinase) [Apiospora rasikravindrae]|uniref:D-amino acid hydantoin hydrolase (Hydantoinase) n=1 Tax=Apiospora rasikravindrae TaxID=990691 RepID=A0ABR1RR38_9PEZI